MRDQGEYMMAAGREFPPLGRTKGHILTSGREWAQRVRPLDGLIVKEK
jgi:hypothetical protein